MRFFDRFRKKKHSEPRIVGVSPGGSDLIKYEGGEFTKTPIGFLDESVAALAQLREDAYEKMFGPAENVFHELLPFIPHVDVYTFPPVGKRDFFTLITSGMSDLDMTVPDEIGSEVSRAELIMYVDMPEEGYLELLRKLAHFPHDNKSWFGRGHTMQNGTPPEKIFPGHVQDTFLFMPTILHPDQDLQLCIDGKQLNLLWLVPISSAECQFKLYNGIDALYDLFDKVRHPYVFSISVPRNSYV